jgi:hypothetical protein
VVQVDEAERIADVAKSKVVNRLMVRAVAVVVAQHHTMASSAEIRALRVIGREVRDGSIERGVMRDNEVQRQILYIY